MPTSTLDVVIRGKNLLTPTVNQANASLSTLGRTADGLKGSVLTGLGLGAGVAGFTLVTSAIGTAAGVLADATRAAIEDEASIRKLTQTLTENVPAWNGSLASIDAFVKKGQALAFTDDAIREAVGKLTVSTGDVGKALDLTRLSMDLARLKGIDLATATDYINKALGGQVGALRRVLPFIDKNATSTQALAAIQKAAQGQADSYAQTTDGRLTKAQIALDEAMERLGYITMPAVASAAQVVADAANGLIPVIDELAGAVGGLVDALAFAVQGYADLAAATTVSENPARDFYDLTRNNELATRDFGTALGIAADKSYPYVDQLHYIASASLDAATNVRALAAEEKAQAAQALITEWNAQAVGDAYDRVSNAANLAAERTDMLRKVQDGGAYSATIAATGAWTQATAYEALNKGLERAGLGATATDERLKKLTTAEGAKGSAARGLATDLHGEADAMDTATAAAKKLEEATKPKGKVAPIAPEKETRGGAQRSGGTEGGMATTTTPASAPAPATTPLYGTYPVGSGAAVVLPTTTPSVVNAPLSSPPVMAQGTAAPASAYAFSFYLDGKAISDAVEVYLGRKSA